jgi:hypothetical protein
LEAHFVNRLGIRRFIPVTVFLAAMFLPGGLAADEDKCAHPTVVSDPDYKPGQVWSDRTRLDEDSSTITILRVESTPKIGVIVHVRIDGFKFTNCAGGPAPTSMEHAPFTKSAIEKSVVRLLRMETRIPNLEGYNDWLAHCGGVYTISVAEALKVVNDTFNSGQGCK